MEQRHLYSAEKPMSDRRDYAHRADVVARVVKWLRRQAEPAAEVPQEVAGADAALRILKQLAVRALARRVSGGWLPSPVLIAPVRWDGDVVIVG